MTRLSFSAPEVEPFVLDLHRYRQRVGDAEPAFRNILRYQIQANREEFAAGGGQRTGKWAPLSEKYKAWKSRVRPGAPLMVFDGDLRDSLTSNTAGIRETWSSGMTIGTAIPCAIYHQTGAGHLPQRRVIGESTRQDQIKFAKILNRFIQEGH